MNWKSVSRYIPKYVQFVSYIFSQIDVKGEKDVERGEDPKGEAEEEEKSFVDLLDEYLPDCIKVCCAFCCYSCFWFCLIPFCVSPCEKCSRLCKK